MNPVSTHLEPVGFGCFGKLPLSREFLVEGASELTGCGFDQWVGEGVGLAKARLGARHGELIKSFPRYWFYWGGGSELKLAGTMCPSQDEAGRMHPFSLFAQLRGKQQSALSSAFQSWGRQEQANALYESVLTIEASEVLRETVRSAEMEQPASLANYSDQYQCYIMEQTCDAFWRKHQANEGNDCRFTVIQALMETLSPLRNNEDRAFRGGIRFPLSPGDSKNAALESCFWLDLTERYLGRPLSDAWWFCSTSESDAASPYFFLFLSPPSGSQWISLIDVDNDLDSISYLDRPYGIEPPEQRMVPELRTILESDSSLLSDCLQWASEV